VGAMSALRPTPLAGLILLAAGLLLVLLTGLGTASAATVTVRSGDTLGAIAARHGTTVAELARANAIADPDVVAAGRRLVVPGGGGSASAATPAASGGGYVVRPGDTLGAIAARNGTTVAALAGANGIANPDVLAVGQRLRLPAGGAARVAPVRASGGHVVRPGDTLGAIAARNGTTVAALAALNGLRDPDRLAVGRRLSIPAGSPGGSLGAPTPPGQVADLLHRYAGRHGVDPSLARAIAWQESRWTQSARSSAGAVGVMQLMPATARWLGRDILGRSLDPTRLEDNIEGGVAYLSWLQRQGADTRTVIGAYYQGLHAMRVRGPYDDTRDYIASVLSFRGRV
jgi:N-acetylmuramoyl-L-alanine amidase